MFSPKILQIIKFTTLVDCQLNQKEKEEDLVHNIHDNLGNDEFTPILFDFGDLESEDDDAEHDVFPSPNSTSQRINDDSDSSHNLSPLHRSSAVNRGLNNLSGTNPITSRNSSSNDENVINDSDQSSSDNELNEEAGRKLKQ